MKGKKVISIALATLFVFIFVFAGSSAETNDRIFSSYDPEVMYPGYGECEKHKEFIESSQLSERVLKHISTDELIEVILHTPIILDTFFAYDANFGNALTRLTPRLNTLAELENRSDAGNLLLKKYLSTAILKTEKEFTTIDDVMEYFRIVFLEMFLGRDVFFKQLSETEINILFTEASQKQTEAEIQGFYEEPFLGRFFSDMEAVALAAYNIYEPFPAQEELKQTVTLTTYGGETVSALYIVDGELDDSDWMALYTEMAFHPNVTQVGSPTHCYNCHSYAWYSQSMYNHYWINTADAYLADSHTVANAQDSNIIHYASSSDDSLHSGIIDGYDNGTLMVVSKWGCFGVYRHEWDDVPADYMPYGGSQTNYYYHTLHEYSSWMYYNGTQHYRSCSICGKTEYAAHVLNEEQTMCIVCGSTGPFAINKTIIYGIIKEA